MGLKRLSAKMDTKAITKASNDKRLNLEKTENDEYFFGF